MNTNFTKDQYDGTYHDHILEQYKLYVEMTDKVSDRRMAANTAFISIETLLLAAPALFNSEERVYAIVFAVVGILLSVAWFSLLSRYRQLNSAKFKVIFELEALLPTSPYDEEWTKLGRGKQYRSLSKYESALPFLFAALYGVILLGLIR